MLRYNVNFKMLQSSKCFHVFLFGHSVLWVVSFSKFLKFDVSVKYTTTGHLTYKWLCLLYFLLVMHIFEIFFTVVSNYKYNEGVFVVTTTGSFSHRDLSANYKENLTLSGFG